VYLQNSHIVIEDTLIFGSTLWTNLDDNQIKSLDRSINDYFKIYKGGKMFTTADSNELNIKARKHLAESVDYANMNSMKCVVMTHHAPSYQFGTPEFAGSDINPLFNNSDMDDMIAQSNIKLWVHGHRHSQADDYIGNTRIVCNPYGYPNERRYIADFGNKTQPIFVEV
jgi:Icc-related predicted phosphoesterase